MSYETGGCDENAALADDHRLAFGFEVPQIGQSQRHKRSRGHARVGALWLSADRSKAVLTTIPCTRGSAPVPMVAWPSGVIVGRKLTRALLNQAPSRRKRDRVGKTS